MHSKRILKKEVNALMREFMSDAFALISAHPDRREDVIAKISDVAELRNNLMDGIRHPRPQENETTRKFYAQLRKEFLQELDKAYRDLSGIAAGKKEKPAKPKPKPKPKSEPSKPPKPATDKDEKS